MTTAVTTAVVIRALLPYIFPKKLLRLQDKYVVITGCDTGFGSLAVDEITKSGAKVIAMCLTVEGCKAAITSGKLNAYLRLEPEYVRFIYIKLFRSF